jgi:23S rRNA (cytidine1920-2'-O)/16S rRNA (cytidine1409-2'-O)-methyltransferase
VWVDGAVAAKAARPVAPDSEVTVDAAAPRWVSRAGPKLRAALDTWASEGLSVSGRHCVDVGACTGGFTQVLLHAGAAHVVAVDVGRGQLATTVAEDPRVVDRSGTTIRGLVPTDVDGPVDLVVADLSFISLTVVLVDLVPLLRPTGDLVSLVKPQFEVGRSRLGRTGVVTAAADRARALNGVVGAATASGLHIHGIMRSPVIGSTGNTEYLLWARPAPSATMTTERVARAVRELTTDHPTGGRR